MERGTSEGRYLIEVNGVTACRASEVSGIKMTHEEFELYESNRPNPHLGRGHYKCEPITVKHAHALNNSGDEFFSWIEKFVTGATVERRGARLMVLDEDGKTPVTTYELEECVPISFEPETHSAGGRNASFFRFTLRPTDMYLL